MSLEEIQSSLEKVLRTVEKQEVTIKPLDHIAANIEHLEVPNEAKYSPKRFMLKKLSAKSGCNTVDSSEQTSDEPNKDDSPNDSLSVINPSFQRDDIAGSSGEKFSITVPAIFYMLEA